MQQVEASVVELHPGSRRATVGIRRASACARCLAGRGCGAGLFAADGLVHLEVDLTDATEPLRTGDKITLELAPARLIEASLLAYGLPLSGLLAAAMLASLLGLGEAGTVLFAVAGLGAGFALSRARLRRIDCMRRFRLRPGGRVA